MQYKFFCTKGDFKLMSNTYAEIANGEQIKLVIWDLDETFWAGTLSEGEVFPIEKNIGIVKTLTKRGIINSISSKNNFEDAVKKLKELNIFEYFVFPAINWNTKGPQIKNLIKAANLRDNNVLFIDDNDTNLNEAKYYCPNIKIASPNILKNILEFASLAGKNDERCTRLAQYKILEKKNKHKEELKDDLKFLHLSNIQVEIKSFVEDDLDRILEMIHRTNQLNFTKKKIDKNELLDILNDNNYKKGVVFCKDNYGDYGCIGFYALNKREDLLEHFLFSCRIMNLGVEQWVYAYLNFPNINIQYPVSSTLNKTTKPNWINNKHLDKKTKNLNTKKIKVLLAGNCEFMSMSHYAKNSHFDLLFYVDFNKDTHFRLRYDSINELKNSIELNKETKQRLINKYSFIDNETFHNRLLYEDYDYLVFSLIYEYNLEQYRDDETGAILPNIYPGYKTNPFKDEPIEVSKELERLNIHFGINEIIQLQKETTSLGYNTAKDLEENLYYLKNAVKKPIIFINGPEVEHPNASNPKEVNEKYIKFNKIVDDFCAKNDNCYVIDIRKYVKTRDDMTDVKTHYKRMTYVNLTEDLIKLLSKLENIKSFYLLNKIRNIIILFFDKFRIAEKYNLFITKIKQIRKKIIKFRLTKNEKYLIILGKEIFNKQNKLE